MVEGALNFKHGYIIDDKRIAYIEDKRISYRMNFGYKSVFAHYY